MWWTKTDENESGVIEIATRGARFESLYVLGLKSGTLERTSDREF
jgi:hypothetical protein